MKRILKWIFRIVLVLLILAFLFVFVAYWRSTNDCDQLTAAQGDKMKAIVYCDYGLANLKLAEIAKPTPDGRSNPGQSSCRFGQPAMTGTSLKARP